MESLPEIAARCLDWIKSQSSGLEAEIYLGRAEERGLEMREGRLDGIQQSLSEGLGLRILSSGRMGFASSGGLSLETLKDLFGKVVRQMDYLEPDSFKAFPKGRPADSDPGLSDSLWDETLFMEGWEKVLPRLKEMEASVLAYDKRIKSVLRLGYGESRGEVVIASTRGVMARERGSSASAGLSALSGQDGELQTGSAYQSERKRGALDFAKVAREAAQRSVALLGARKLPGGRRSVLIDPWVAGEFLELVAHLLCADQVQRGKSLLAGKLGRKIGSELVTFIDDPRRPGGMASSLYDDEGCPTARKTMIEKGVVKEYFYDTYTANKDGRSSNASAARGSYKGLPSPDCSNFHLAPGGKSREKVISETRDGILVLEIMGMHMADPISGEFSVGVSGLAVEKGRLTHAVKSAMISGNLLELLGRVDEVADDLAFYGGMGAPTFRISHMTVA